MKRRAFVGMALPIVAAQWRGPDRLDRATTQDLRLVLRSGRSFRQGEWRTDDVGIDASGRLRFGTNLQAAQIIDVTNKVVAPGFIDILADNGANHARAVPIFEKYKVSDGVTTALQMHGGSADCAGYHASAAEMPHAINHGVSTAVMAIRLRTSNLRARKLAVERNLAEGALGVSHSLEYQPTPFAEILAYAKLARSYDRPLFLHLRYSSAEQELDGVGEAVRIATETGARVHIDHLHSTGGTWHMEEALTMIRAANARGCSITTCIYPYTFWATYLYSRRFNPGWQQRYGIGYADLRVVGTGERLTAESFARYRQTVTLVAVPDGTMPRDKTFGLALREDFCLVGSDGGIQTEPRANSHPRGAGCFATAARQGLEIGLPLEGILAKITSLPASVLRPALDGRGILENGAIADLTVFDPRAIRGNATLENPNQVSSGIDLVIVNGKVAYRNGQLETKNGAAIRY